MTSVKNCGENKNKCVNNGKNVLTHFREWCKFTSIHGFKYFGEERTFCEKIWWIISITLCIFFCSTMIYRIFLKYSYYPVIVTFSMKETRLQKLPFPAITICPRAKISQKYFNLTEYASKQVNNLPTTEEEDKQMDLASTICDFEITNKTKTVEAQEFYNFLGKNRMDNFHYCQYLNMEQNCTDMFTPILTEEGICYSFNILDKNDIYRNNTEVIFKDFHTFPATKWNLEKGYFTKDIDTFPTRALRVGARNQLMIILKTRIDNIEFQCPQDESGYRVAIHLPSDIPEVPENHIYLPLNQKIIGAIVPHTIQTSLGVKNFAPSKRDCYFQSERHLKFFKIYSRGNCMLECKTNYTLSECGCVAFHMPKEPGTPICLLDKLTCFEDALDNFSIFNEDNESEKETETYTESICDCKPTCTDVTYNADLSYNTIFYEILNKTLKNEIDFENHIYTVLSLYFKNNHVETKERNELYGFSDVISNFGGLLGLFTGFSILSFLEILYFLSLRIWGNIRIYGTWIDPNNG